MTAVPTYPCARCGKKLLAERMIFSTFTRARYCRDMVECDRRYFKQKKAAA